MLWEHLSGISVEDGLVVWRQEEHTSHRESTGPLQGKGEFSSSDIVVIGPSHYKSTRSLKETTF